MLRIRPFLPIVLLLWMITGCNLAAPAEALIPPTPTTLSMLRGTAVPTLERIYNPVNAPTDSPINLTASVTPEPLCDLDKTLPATRHVVSAALDYAARHVVVDQTITYIHRDAVPLTDLVLNVEPNRYPGAFTLNAISMDSATPEFELTGRRLVVKLVEPLQDDCALKLRLQFLIQIPQVGGGAQAFKGYFGHSERQVNLGHWLPTVALRVGSEWITRQAVFVGEQEVLTKADWDVTLKVDNAAETLKIAAPGEAEEIASNHWRFVSPAARDFTLSMSESFQVHQAETKDGVTLEVYSFDDAVVETSSGKLNGAEHALNVGLDALEAYSDLFGAYPYGRLLVVQGDFPDGMEFSGIVFVSTDWFKRFTGDPAGYLTLITVHEVAHQWWYAQVGSDPALAPWLDEALATYCEYIFLEEFYPELKSWWWEFRVDNYSPAGFVDSTVYEFSSIREYINAVYLRGVKMLHALRQDIGTEAFFDWLRRYAEAGSGEVVTPNFFWSLLSPEQFEATRLTRMTYLRTPNTAAAP
jgi:hypothetical protein